MARTTRGASSRRAKKNTITLDLSQVEGRVSFTEGDHLLEVQEVTQDKGPKGDYLNWKFKCIEGDSEGAIVYNNTSLSEQSLWNVRTLLEALGVEIPDSEFDIDLEELAELQLMGSIELETYEGKKRPRLVDFWAAEEAEVEEKPKSRRGKKAAADEEEEAPKKRTRGKKADPEPEEAQLTQDDINDMTEEELEDVIEEHDLDVDLDDFKTLRKQRAAVIDAAQEAGILAEEEEPEVEEPEEEEKPARRRRSRKAAEPEEEEEKPARRRRSRR